MTDLAAWGIAAGYNDHRNEWRVAPPTTVQALLDVMGAGDAERPPGLGDDNPVWVVGAGEAVHVEGPWELRTHDGATLRVEGGALPPDVPIGYHRLSRLDDGRRVRLIVSPRRCFLPDGLHTWGWAVQLYAARSRASWGIGDLADLRRIGSWSRSQGAGMLLSNPLHASLVGAEQQPSPYFPSSRCFRNPLYLRIEEVPGAPEARLDLIALSAQGKALNADRRIDRDRVWALKLEALERLWRRFSGDPAFDRYCDEEGPALAGYATFSAIAERHGAPWQAWPTGLQDPDSAAVLHFVDEHHERIRFHQWLQWLLDRQLAAAGAEIDVMQDLAIGVDPAGADAWLWRGCFAPGVRVGAPPDEFNTQGQDWGLPPFDPWRLRLAAYEPFIRTLRAGFRHAGGLRFDHVMGLFRLFWIPEGAGAADGTYVQYPWRELLDILAVESHRAGAYVVGEDLGTVEDEMREALADRNVLSYRLLWFEPSPPPSFPRQALSAVTTHDLPTVAGLWGGSDLAEQEALGLSPNVESTNAIHERLEGWLGLPAGAPVLEVVDAAYALLATAPSRLLTATLDDALCVDERPNVPGTTDERPNWSMALPLPLEELEVEERPARIARSLDRRTAGPAAPFTPASSPPAST